MKDTHLLKAEIRQLTVEGRVACKRYNECLEKRNYIEENFDKDPEYSKRSIHDVMHELVALQVEADQSLARVALCSRKIKKLKAQMNAQDGGNDDEEEI